MPERDANRADAPADDATVRPPQSHALVIDRSGSMQGRPLAEARRCAEFVVCRLRPADAVSVVQFDNRVERLWPAVPLGDGDAVRGAIGRVHAGGNTNLHGGWLEGAESLADARGAGLKRVILLSDGCANEGLTDSAEIATQCAAWAAKGVTTSTYGLGDNFNEDLMVAMARTGGGNHYYGDTAEDLMEPFQQELDLLANLALRQVELSASVLDGPGHHVHSLPADRSDDGHGRGFQRGVPGRPADAKVVEQVVAAPDVRIVSVLAGLRHRRGSMSIGFDTGFSSGALLGTAAGVIDGISRMNVAIERARSRSA